MPTQTFNFTGAVQRWRVPTGVKIVDVILDGASSGTRQGGRVVGRLRVTGGTALYLTVGEQGNPASGATPGTGTFGGGGSGGKGSGSTRPGGASGGGGSWIRYGATDGPVRAAAGGAGGSSGDGGLGGRGGNSPAERDRGENGGPGTGAGAAAIGNATGGTQNQGGRGGTTTLGEAYRGQTAPSIKIGRAGRGGTREVGQMYGGGGGGGGYYPGGGGQAGIFALSRGGGGGGGSNYTDGLFNITSSRGAASLGNGRIVLTWDTPGGDTPPTAPNNLKINGVDISDGMATRATSLVSLTGNPNDPNLSPDTRLYVKMADNAQFAGHSVTVGTYDDQEDRDQVVLRGLQQNTRYYLRVHTQSQPGGKVSVNYTSVNFWTNRSPLPPTLLSPAENSDIADVTNLVFTWNHVDPDEGPDNVQRAYEFRYRRAARPGLPATDWVGSTQITSAETRTFTAYAGGGPFTPNYDWEWSVRTQDQQGKWGSFSQARSFFITGTSLAPIPVAPVKDMANIYNSPIYFYWKFRTTASAVAQSRADLRLRPVGTPSWVSFDNFATSEQMGVLDAGEVDPQVRYEWQVRTYAGAVVSDWSESGSFWTTLNPGYLVDTNPFDSGRAANGLGEGRNRAFVYERGGTVLRGEIKNPRLIRWGRKRDDISACTLYIDEFDRDTRALLGSTHSWRHEIVVFRENADGRVDRVWEGPVTRKSTSRTSAELEAKDVMGYLYRRIMRQGFSDAYQLISGSQTGLKTIIQRATQIILNALAYDDPNVIGYLTPMAAAGDAKSSRVRPDFSRMAWEEIDDMAAVAGLDYVAVGRRIILNDTHRAIGRLPEMGDGDFSEPPVISEYGMSAAYLFAVTDGSGLYGTAFPTGNPPVGPEGWIEQLASAYGEEQTAGQGGELTNAQIQARRDAFADQAALNISGRWPIPTLVRVPDNARLSPELQVGINQLVPGVWIPLRADNGLTSISQWQKLDQITCEQSGDNEKITVVMSPAPNEGQDPDRDTAVIEAGA